MILIKHDEYQKYKTKKKKGKYILLINPDIQI